MTEVMTEVAGLDIYARLYENGSFHLFTDEEGYKDMEQYQDPEYRGFHYYDEDSNKKIPCPTLIAQATENLCSAFWQDVAYINDIIGEY